MPALGGCVFLGVTVISLFFVFLCVDELLQVEEEHYAPLLPRAELLLKRHGDQVLAAMLALLYGKHRFPGLPEGKHRYSSRESSGGRRDREDDSSLLAVRSLLTGRKGYVAVLVYDPTHTVRMSMLGDKERPSWSRFLVDKEVFLVYTSADLHVDCRCCFSIWNACIYICNMDRETWREPESLCHSFASMPNAYEERL